MSRVLVGIIANDSARYSLFASCVTKLDTDGLDADVEWLIGGDWCGARNDLARMCLDEGYDYLWFMDDDHAFPPGILKQLLSWGLPLVNPMCLARVAPFPLVTYAANPDPNATGRYLPVSLDGAPEEGLIELEAGGCAGMLIARSVLEAVPEPWFEYTDRSEDIVFCEKARAAGFHLYGDLSARLGHITTAVVWPAVNEGRWMTGITVGRDLNLFVSAAEEWEPIEEDPATTPVEAPPVSDPCTICGRQAQWHDIHGRWGCDEHHPTHEAWLSYFERVEIWYDPDENRWHGRLLDGEGRVVIPSGFGPWLQEASALEYIESTYPGVGVFLITGPLDDSRTGRRMGPPLRLWTRESTQ